MRDGEKTSRKDCFWRKGQTPAPRLQALRPGVIALFRRETASRAGL